MAFPELLAQGLEPHKVREVYLMWWENPEVVVDITDTIDLKIKALACHASQFKDFAAVEKRVRERGAELGKPQGLRLRGDLRPDLDGPLVAELPVGGAFARMPP